MNGLKKRKKKQKGPLEQKDESFWYFKWFQLF